MQTLGPLQEGGKPQIPALVFSAGVALTRKSGAMWGPVCKEIEVPIPEGPGSQLVE